MGDVPRLPRFVALALLLPQLGFVLLLMIGGDAGRWQGAARTGAIGWATLMLAFYAGSWAGIAASAPAAQRRGALGWLWWAALVVMAGAAACLLGFMAGLVPAEPVLVMLGGALLMTPLIDARLGPLAPRWWATMRVPLAIGLGVATAAVALI